MPTTPVGFNISDVSLDPATMLFYFDLTWPTPVLGNHMACFVAVNSLKLTSDPHCVNVCVRGCLHKFKFNLNQSSLFQAFSQ